MSPRAALYFGSGRVKYVGFCKGMHSEDKWMYFEHRICIVLLSYTIVHIYPRPGRVSSIIELTSPKTISKYCYFAHSPSSTPPTAVTSPPPSAAYSPPLTPPHVPIPSWTRSRPQRSPDRPKVHVVGGIDGVNQESHHLVPLVFARRPLRNEPRLQRRRTAIRPWGLAREGDVGGTRVMKPMGPRINYGLLE